MSASCIPEWWESWKLKSDRGWWRMSLRLGRSREDGLRRLPACGGEVEAPPREGGGRRGDSPQSPRVASDQGLNEKIMESLVMRPSSAAGARGRCCKRPTRRELDCPDRTKRDRRRLSGFDEIDVVLAVATAVCSFRMKKDVARPGSTQGVRLYEAVLPLIAQVNQQVVYGGEADYLQRKTATPRRHCRRR